MDSPASGYIRQDNLSNSFLPQTLTTEQHFFYQLIGKPFSVGTFASWVTKFILMHGLSL